MLRDSGGLLRRQRRRSSQLVATAMVPSFDVAACICAWTLRNLATTVAGLLYLVAAFIALLFTRMHRPRLNPRVADDVLSVAACMTLPLAVLAPFESSARALESLSWLSSTCLLFVLIGRCLAYGVLRFMRLRRNVFERVLIVGAGEVGAEVARVLREHPEYGLVPVGFADSRKTAHLMPVVSDISTLNGAVDQLAVSQVIVAFSGSCDAEMVRVLRRCLSLPVTVRVIPRFFEIGVAIPECYVEDVWGFPLVTLRRSGDRCSVRRPKRVFDVIAGSILLFVSAPLFIVSAAAVRLSGPGPVFFRQKRVGDNGRIIEVLKFRTLAVNDDCDTRWCVADDDRRTRVGRILRRTSIDELPQLFNVLRGDMSLVGPRPERPHFANLFSSVFPDYDDRQRVPQGITGWAQVHGLRGDTNIGDRARFDNYYIQHWSLWRDVVILARTIAAIMKSPGR